MAQELTKAAPHDQQGAPSIVVERPAAGCITGDVAAGPSHLAPSDRWPGWARDDLERAVAVAGRVRPSAGLATALYREWFNPEVDQEGAAVGRPLPGLYRAAHAAHVTERHDRVGVDGWWRTWGGSGGHLPRSGAMRLFCTPRVDRLAEFVHAVTRGLGRSTTPWSLACSTHPGRLLRTAGATLDIADLDLVDDRLLADLAPTLHAVRPPLTLRLADGVGLAAHPGHGMSFGEHRCHLVATALHHPSSGRDPLRAIAAVFAAHGIDPARPHQ